MEWSWRLTEGGRPYSLRSYKWYWKHHRRKLPELRPREREEAFLSVQQFADHLQLSAEHVRRLVRRGQISLVPTNLVFRIPKNDLYAYCKAQKRRHGTILALINGGRDRNDLQLTGDR